MKTNGKLLHFLFQFLSPKSSKISWKPLPKCCIGTARLHLGATLARTHLVLSLKDSFEVPQAPHFDVIRTSFGTNFQAVQLVLTSFLVQFQGSTLHNCIKKTRCPVKTEPLIIHHPHLTACGTFVWLSTRWLCTRQRTRQLWSHSNQQLKQKTQKRVT